MPDHLSVGLVLGYLGIILALLSTFMKSMEPLRMVALVGNLVGMSYGYMESVWPTFFGNLLLMPINLVRLWEMRKLIHAMEQARGSDSVSELLLPHMKLSRLEAGHVLFSIGDSADEMFFLQSGSVRLNEIEKTLLAGSAFGEIGLFARDSRRTLTAVCETDCELYRMTRERFYMLYYQNPKIGFNLMSLVVERLLPVPAQQPTRH
jgi:hypothetical protein